MSTKSTTPAPSFLQVYTQVRRNRMKHSFLRQINKCVDWRGIRTLLNKKYTKTQNAVGNPAYDALMMFKILLLQTWYGLSDYEVEDELSGFRRDVKVWWQNVPNGLQDERIVGLTPHLGCC